MALTLQRKIELAGALSKVQPLLQRLHLVESPKKRDGLRNVVLVGSAIVAGAVVVAVVCRRRCWSDACAGNGGDAEAASPRQSMRDAEPDLEGAAETGVREPNDLGAPGPA